MPMDPMVDVDNPANPSNPFRQSPSPLLDLLIQMTRQDPGDGSLGPVLESIRGNLEGRQARRFGSAAQLGFDAGTEEKLPEKVTEQRGPVGSWLQKMGILNEPEPRPLDPVERTAAIYGVIQRQQLRQQQNKQILDMLGMGMKAAGQYGGEAGQNILRAAGLGGMADVLPHMTTKEIQEVGRNLDRYSKMWKRGEDVKQRNKELGIQAGNLGMRGAELGFQKSKFQQDLDQRREEFAQRTYKIDNDIRLANQRGDLAAKRAAQTAKQQLQTDVKTYTDRTLKPYNDEIDATIRAQAHLKQQHMMEPYMMKPEEYNQALEVLDSHIHSLIQKRSDIENNIRGNAGLPSYGDMMEPPPSGRAPTQHELGPGGIKRPTRKYME